jgi:hypothetical protein
MVTNEVTNEVTNKLADEFAKAFVVALATAARHVQPVVSHRQVTRSRTLRFAGHFCSTVKRLIDRVEYKKMRPSLYWPHCSACITT